MCDRKEKTCTRCGGKGFVSSSVAHLGVPGLCYKCDGSRKLIWVTAEEVTALKRKQLEAHLLEITERGNATKSRLAEKTASHEKRKEWAKANGKMIGDTSCTMEYLSQDLESLRKLYREIKKEVAELPSKKLRGKWVAPSQVRSYAKANERNEK